VMSREAAEPVAVEARLTLLVAHGHDMCGQP
jgi:hypothetical protein